MPEYQDASLDASPWDAGESRADGAGTLIARGWRDSGASSGASRGDFAGGASASSGATPAKNRRKSLLADLRRQLKALEDDIRLRLEDLPEVRDALARDWEAARDVARTALSFADWRETEITQAAVHWLLSCVFVRFIEDNGLIRTPLLAGPTTERLARARYRHEEFFRNHPRLSDRDYLIDAFETVEHQPGMAALFDREHNPIWRLQPSGDGATAVLTFFQRVDPSSGALIHDFTSPGLDTRFLGDLYQDLSEAARSRFALLQTPEFVEEFILDRTLEPAIREFGPAEARLIDPTCGSGHFLLGAFHRLLDHWRREQPQLPVRELAQRALDGVFGVDLNPFAVAIARFRLTLAALTACGIARLADAPAFRLNLACGDSLLHGRHFGTMAFPLDDGAQAKVLRHVYATEDAEELARILGRQYHAVVGNPPYITVKDKALNNAYRTLFAACHRAYALSVPFIERFFDLALDGRAAPDAGYVGLIVSNSFMKREFGSKLIEQVLPTLDLTDIIDTAGAYIPGHGTPTCILFGRNRAPVGGTLKTVLGIKGEPGRPEDPARGLVWRAIVEQIDAPGSESPFISVSTPRRAVFARHPWSIGGGGAVELKEHMEKIVRKRLKEVIATISSICITREDDAYIMSHSAIRRAHIDENHIVLCVGGEDVRDYGISVNNRAIYPYDEQMEPVDINGFESMLRFLWPSKEYLWRRKELNGDHRQTGRTWWEWNRFLSRWHQRPLSIAFAFVATHNHFVFDTGDKIFIRSSPVIKLRHNADEDEYLSLLGVLNSSVACFWLKEVSHNKGSQGVSEGVKAEPWERFYEFTGTGLEGFPLAEPYPLDLARALDDRARRFSAAQPAAVVAQGVPTRARLDAARAEAGAARAEMIALQEELDWDCYRLYGLGNGTVIPQAGQSIVPLALGERAFEIVMARQVAAGELETTWFERHRSTPVTEPPGHWPEGYARVVEERIALIESDRFLNLLERPEYKRRWAQEPWPELEKKALRGWLLDRLELPRYWDHEELITTARLADLALDDADFLQVAELHEGRGGVDVPGLIATLVRAEAVPYLPVLRYSETGLRKRALWEPTWTLQRREDAGETVGGIPLPPKYRAADFLDSVFWRLRGPLDVPKERFIAYPGLSRDGDGSLTIAWAGWNHLQQARALAATFLQLKDQTGWGADRLSAPLAGLLELVPWLKQWHNQPDPIYGARMGDYFHDFVRSEARELGLTPDAVRAWSPPATGRRGRTGR